MEVLLAILKAFLLAVVWPMFQEKQAKQQEQPQTEYQRHLQTRYRELPMRGVSLTGTDCGEM